MFGRYKRSTVWVGLWTLCSVMGCSKEPPPPKTVWFDDATESSGVDFVNRCGSPKKDYILDSMGSGGALFDADGDGDLDLYLVQGSTREQVADDSADLVNRLYRNDGEFKFTDVTSAAGVGDRAWGHGCAVADVDGDADLDLYVANWGPNVLYLNDGSGEFADVSSRSGVADGRWSTSAGFADFDVDGDLDLYVANYLDFDWNDPPPLGKSWKGVPSYTGPHGLTPQRDGLYRNEGDGTFVDVSVESGIDAVIPAFSLALVWFDADEDGDPDLYVANDTTPNYLFRNEGGGRFEEDGAVTGLAYNADGAAQAGMGVSIGDPNHDGKADLLVTNFSFDYNTLYLNLGSGFWEATNGEGELRSDSHHTMGWGVGFLDVECDGDDDLLVANGHLYPAIDQSPSLREISPYRQRNALFVNDGTGSFRNASDHAGPGLAVTRCSRALILGDIDDDGDVDGVVTNIDDRVTLLRNESVRGHWVSFQLEQSDGNRFAIGARVLVMGGGETSSKEVSGVSSYLSHHDLRLHFGLGAVTTVDATIVWPDGVRQELRGLGVDQLHRIRRGAQ